MPGDDPADLYISLGRYNDSIKDISASYREARTAITLAEQMHWSNRLISYDQMGIYRFLASVCDQPAAGSASSVWSERLVSVNWQYSPIKDN